MSLDFNDLQLLKYLQENNDISLTDTAAHFYRNTSSIRRQLAVIGQHLDGQYPIVIYNSRIIANLSYSDYLAIIKNLTMDNYILSCKERLQYLITRSFYEGTINLSRIYEQLGLSPTTKKSDTAKLRSLLSVYGLEIEIVKKKGIRIAGDELHFRMLLVEILLPLLEWDSQLQLKNRQANTPIQRLMTGLCITNCHQKEQLVLDEQLEAYHLSYQSRKLLTLYLSLLTNRKNLNPILTVEQTKLMVTDWKLLKDPLENEALLRIIAMLDYESGPAIPYHPLLAEKTNQLLTAVSSHYQITFYRQQQMQAELCHYFYKVYFQNFYRIQIKDKMVRDTEKRFPELYQMVRLLTVEISDFLETPLTTENYTTLTLILKKWIAYHQLAGDNCLRIILVTNTSPERSRFFISTLKDLVEFQLAAIISIQEIDRIKELDYDHIITLSERTSELLREQGFDFLRLEYFLSTRDLSHLLKAGFSPARKRLLSAQLARQMAGLTENEIQELLQQEYSEYVI